MKRKKVIISILAAAAILGSVTWVSSTRAVLIADDSVTNSFTTGSVGIVNVENDGKGFTDNGKLGKGNVDKKVQVKNDEKCAVIIRTALIPRWTTSDGNAWAGDTSCVSLNMTANVTKDFDTWKAGEIPLWYESGGYYYYNQIVQPDETTNVLMDSVSANIPEDLKDRYDGKKLVVDVKSEGVLATSGTYKNVWPNVDSVVGQALDALLQKSTS